MNENEEVPETNEDKSVKPAKPVIPKGYKLGPRAREGWTYGRLATVSLVVAKVSSFLGCLAILLIGFCEFCVGYASGDIMLVLLSLVGTPMAFMLQFAMLVVFLRVADLKSQ